MVRSKSIEISVTRFLHCDWMYAVFLVLMSILVEGATVDTDNYFKSNVELIINTARFICTVVPPFYAVFGRKG